jgi:hypothetical protein
MSSKLLSAGADVSGSSTMGSGAAAVVCESVPGDAELIADSMVSELDWPSGGDDPACGTDG